MALIKFVAQIFGLQLVVITIVVFVLLKILNRHLIESALHQLESLFPKEIDRDLEKIVVVVPKTLSQNARKRIEDAAFKKLGRNVALVIQNDPHIKSGMIIQLNNFTIDCSLISRLKDSGLMK